jgi:hypothetical protein
MGKRRRKHHKGGGKKKKKGAKADGVKRDVVGRHLPVTDKKKRISLAIHGREVEQLPVKPKVMPQTVGRDVFLRPSPYTLYANPQEELPSYASSEYRNKVDNAQSRRKYYRTQIRDMYEEPRNLVQYRRREQLDPSLPRSHTVFSAD